jgi:hypothetical protein
MVALSKESRAARRRRAITGSLSSRWAPSRVARTRARISRVALSVKVTTKIDSRLAPSLTRSTTMRSSVQVLPVPAEASIHVG